jgi:hypothetical protein
MNLYYDVIRLEDTPFHLPSALRIQQSGHENSGSYKMGYKKSDGSMIYWTPDGYADHTTLLHLDYASSGHTGFSPTVHGHTSSQVTYTNSGYPSFTNTTDALNYLLHTVIAVSGVGLTPSYQEKGQTLSSLAVSWSVNHNGTTQSITVIGAEGGSIPVANRSFNYSALSKTTDFSVSITAADSYDSSSSGASMYFMLRKYWGQSASATPNEAIIEAALNGGSSLSVDSSGSRYNSFSQLGGGNYIYYAYPASWGDASLTVNGFASIWNKTVVSITNGYSNTENYNCYTSITPIVGTVSLIFS